MHQYLPGIDRREEVAAEIRRQREGTENESEKADDEYGAMSKRHDEKRTIKQAQSLEAALEAALQPYQWIARVRQRAVESMHIRVRSMRAKQIIRQCRHQSPRENE